LDVSNCSNLEELDCRNNELVNLDINGCFNLRDVDLSNNNLYSLDLTDNLSLEYLNVSNNNFVEQDLSFFKSLINLKELKLENNKFIGSLETLKNLSRLEKLNINNTNINSGLEYLPESVKLLYANLDKSQELQKQLTAKKLILEQLIISAKEKLKSNSKLFDTKRKEREEKLESLFENIPTNPEEFKKSLENIKPGLSKKLTLEEINELCQTKSELTQLQMMKDENDKNNYLLSQLAKVEELTQQTQPLQIQPAYGTPGSSK